MSDERIKELFYNAMSWIYEHCEYYTNYIFALHNIGYTREEIKHELVEECSVDENVVNELMDWYDYEFVGGDE